MRYVIDKCQNNIACLKIKLDGLQIEGIEQDNPILHFPIKTFKSLFVKSGNGYLGKGLLEPVSAFINTLSEVDQQILLMYFVLLHDKILTCFMHEEDVTGDMLKELTDSCSKSVYDMIARLSLQNKLYAFVSENVPINKASSNELRPQDTEDLTYRYNDIVELQTIVFFSKVMVPIFAALMSQLANRKIALDDKMKEYYCFEIVQPSLATFFKQPYDKLKRYIHTSIKRKYHKIVGDDVTSTMLHFGYTPLHMESMLTSFFLVRSMNNLDINYEGSSVVSVLNDMLKNEINMSSRKAKKNNMVAKREDPSRSTEDQGESELELNSVYSTKTLDWQLIGPKFIKKVYQEYVEKYNLDKSLTRALVKHAQTSAVMPNSMSLFLTKLIFTPYFQGSIAIDNLNCFEMSFLLGAIQSRLIALKFYHILPIFTMKRINQHREQITGDARTTVVSFMKISGYKKASSSFSNMQNKRDHVSKIFHDKVRDIVEELVYKVYIFNNAPEIQNLFEIPEVKETFIGNVPINEQEFIINTTTVNQFCEFIYIINMD